MSDNHGNTPAAWTFVVIGLIGFVVGGAGLMLEPVSYLIFWIGVGVVAVAGLIFLVMAKIGLHNTDTRH